MATITMTTRGSVYGVSDTEESPLHPFLNLIPQPLSWVGIVTLIFQVRRSEAQRKELTFPRSHSSYGQNRQATHCTPSQQLAMNPQHLAMNPQHILGTLSPSLAASSKGIFRTPGSHSTLHTKKGSFELDLNCSYSSSFCCKGRKETWKRNVSPAYLPHTQTQREW